MWKKIIAFVMCVSLLTSAVSADYLLGFTDMQDLLGSKDDMWEVLESRYYLTNDNGKYYITSENKDKIGKVYIPALSIVDQDGNVISDNSVLNVGDSQTYYVAVDSSAVKQTNDGLVFYSSKECIFYLDTESISWASTGKSVSRSKSGNGTTLKGVSAGKTRLVAEIPVGVIEYVYGEYVYEGYDDYSGKPVGKGWYEEYDKPKQDSYILGNVAVDANVNVEEKSKKPAARDVPHNPFTGIDISKVRNPFSDISSSDWYYKAVMYLYAAGILNGVDFDGKTVNYYYFDELARPSVESAVSLSASSPMGAATAQTGWNLSETLKPHFSTASSSDSFKFKESTPMDRQNSVIQLYNGHKRIGYSIGSYNKNPFNDVKNGTNSYQPILWASNNGIVNGYGNGKFGPYDHITREQFCAILVRHAKLAGITFQKKYDAKTFTDNYKISSWASSDVVTCQRAGIIQGYPDGSFKPQGDITRAEMCSMIMNYLNQIP